MPSRNRRAHRASAVLFWLFNACVLASCILWVYGHYRGDPSFQEHPWIWIVFMLSAVAFITWLRLRRKPPVARSPEPPGP